MACCLTVPQAITWISVDISLRFCGVCLKELQMSKLLFCIMSLRIIKFSIHAATDSNSRNALIFLVYILAATKQLCEWSCPSVRPSIHMSEQNAVHLASPDTYIKCAIQTSVTPFSLHVCFCHCTCVLSWNFQLSPLTKVMSMQKLKVRGQSSRSQRSKPNLGISGP